MALTNLYVSTEFVYFQTPATDFSMEVKYREIFFLTCILLTPYFWCIYVYSTLEVYWKPNPFDQDLMRTSGCVHTSLPVTQTQVQTSLAQVQIEGL